MLENIESSSDDDDDVDEPNNNELFSSELQITQFRIPTWKALLFRVSDYMNVDGHSIVPAN